MWELVPLHVSLLVTLHAPNGPNWLRAPSSQRSTALAADAELGMRNFTISHSANFGRLLSADSSRLLCRHQQRS